MEVGRKREGGGKEGEWRKGGRGMEGVGGHGGGRQVQKNKEEIVEKWGEYERNKKSKE